MKWGLYLGGIVVASVGASLPPDTAWFLDNLGVVLGCFMCFRAGGIDA